MPTGDPFRSPAQHRQRRVELILFPAAPPQVPTRRPARHIEPGLVRRVLLPGLPPADHRANAAAPMLNTAGRRAFVPVLRYWPWLSKGPARFVRAQFAPAPRAPAPLLLPTRLLPDKKP